jgi:hypothetical protein
MRNPAQNFQDTIGTISASTSVVSALASKATEFQPIISALSGLIAIITGVFAILYYIKKMKKINGENTK